MVVIRPARPSDAAAIDALFHQFVSHLRHIGDHTDYRFGAERYLTDGFGVDPVFRGLVAENGATVIGYLLFSRTYDGDYIRGFYIVDLFVDEGWRNRGVGRKLVDALRDLARGEAITRIAWDVHKQNLDAVRFYESIGARAAKADTTMMYLDV